MTQTPEDEWFAPGAGSSPAYAEPAEDDWLVVGERPRRRTATFDVSALTSAHALALIGVVVIAVVALVAAGFGLSDSSPSSAQIIPIAAAPLRASVLSRTTTPAPAARRLTAPTTPLKPGDSGSQVKILQRELTALGYPVGTIDGSYGTQTGKAVAAFQRANHLTPDGIVGPQTLRALAP